MRKCECAHKRHDGGLNFSVDGARTSGKRASNERVNSEPRANGESANVSCAEAEENATSLSDSNTGRGMEVAVAIQGRDRSTAETRMVQKFSTCMHKFHLHE